jgi:CRISPR/Cas system-associated exonuclease Cas4 (RecB family)
MVYETCPGRAKLRYIEKLPEPPRKENDPLARGSAIHKNLELYVQGKEALSNQAKELKAFEPALNYMCELYIAGQVITEEPWWFDENWQPTKDRSRIWLWSSLDFCVDDDKRVVVGDYKSGKSVYKAVEHVQQLQLYSALAAIKYPDADTIVSELWYMDEGHVKPLVFNRDDALRYVNRFDQRAQRMYDDKFFRFNPTAHNCKWCPYSPRGTGACPVGV